MPFILITYNYHVYNINKLRLQLQTETISTSNNYTKLETQEIFETHRKYFTASKKKNYLANSASSTW